MLASAFQNGKAKSHDPTRPDPTSIRDLIDNEQRSELIVVVPVQNDK